jgi:hypothetical protein
VHEPYLSSVLVWRVADKARELNLQKKLTDRADNKDVKPHPNLVVAGYKKFESSSLATFNKKIADSKVGVLTIQEADNIIPVAFTLNSNDDGYYEELEDDREHSVLHDGED